MIYKAILALGLLLGSQLAMAQQDKYQEGVHYFKIDQLPTQPDSDVVEVTEVFSYACSHCDTFEPYIQNWKKSLPDNVKFDRLPVAFGRKSWEIMARAYIAADMLGIVEESHPAMMDAIWKEHQQFRSVDDLADFYAKFGVQKSTFIGNMQSFAADSQLRRDQRDAQLFGIKGTPSMVVNRKYRVASGKEVPSFDAILDVVDFLVAKESAAP